VSDDILFNHVLHSLVASNAADRVSLVGSAPSQRCSPKEVLDVFSEPDGREREVRTRETLSAGEDIRYDTVIGLVGKHLSAAANTSHYLVNYEQDVILVAKSPDTLNDLGWVH
jgi:hypothetical protein